MKKIISVCVIIVWSLSILNAQDYIRINGQAVESCCMMLNDTLTASVDASWQAGLSYHSWLLRGDLQFADGYNASMSQIKVVCPAEGYGKGCITYRYRTVGCTSAESVDIYKTFAPPAGFAIEGPACVEAGDVVVFSVEPILTVNLDDQIGMDHYYWNINDSVNRPYFVDSVYYMAGDGSSVTFKVKPLIDDSINEIRLNLGRCNKDDASKRVSLPLVKQAPKPEFDRTDFYQPYGSSDVRIEISNIVQNVHYSWTKPNDWSIIDTDNDSTFIVLRLDDNTEGDVIVSAKYVDSQVECAITQSSLHIYRRWGNNIEIEGPTCLIPGQEYIYTIKGEIPNGAEVLWNFPTGMWSHEDNVSQRTIKVTPSMSIGLTDSIIVYEVLGTDTLTPLYKTKVINIKPANVYIEGSTCATPNTIEMYIVRRASDAIGPDANRYEWRVNNVVMQTESDTLYYSTPSYGTRIITVTPLGLDNCDSNTASLDLTISPTPPNGIVRVDSTHCISKGMRDTIILELDGASSEQNYAWYFGHTHEWQRLSGYDPNGNLSKIKVVTTGEAGNDTIIAYATGGSGCFDAEPDTIIFTTDSVPFGLYINDERTNWYDIYMIPNDLTQLAEFSDEDNIQIRWYVDGETDEDNDDMPDISIKKRSYSTSSVVELIVIQNSNCIYSYSASIGEILALSQNINPSQIPMKSRIIAEKLDSDFKMKLHPNPVNNILKVELSGKDVRSVLRVYDMSGNLVLRKIANDKYTEEIDVSSLSDGTYILILNQGQTQSISQIIVKH